MDDLTGNGVPRFIRALPAQLIELSEEDAVIIRRGLTQVKVCGAGACAIASALYSRGTGSLTEAQLLATFSEHEKLAAKELLTSLLSRRMFVAIPIYISCETESPLDIFYWHFDYVAPDLRAKVETCRLIVVGVNKIALRLLQSLTNAGFSNITLIDDPILRDLSFFTHSELGTPSLVDWPGSIYPSAVLGPDEQCSLVADCVIAVSDCGDQDRLRLWNRLCSARGVIFVPAVLKDFVGYIGPIVVPGQSACLECLRGRENSNLQSVSDARAIDALAFDGRDVVAYHPAMIGVLADVLCLEITKVFGIRPLGQVNRCIEINLLRSEMLSRPVLKLPFCTVCSGTNSSSVIDLSNRLPTSQKAFR